MSDKEFKDLESQVRSLIKLSQQLKESNLYLLKQNNELSLRQQELTKTLNSTERRIKILIKDLKSKQN